MGTLTNHDQIVGIPNLVIPIAPPTPMALYRMVKDIVLVGVGGGTLMGPL